MAVVTLMKRFYRGNVEGFTGEFTVLPVRYHPDEMAKIDLVYDPCPYMTRSVEEEAQAVTSMTLSLAEAKEVAQAMLELVEHMEREGN